VKAGRKRIRAPGDDDPAVGEKGDGAAFDVVVEGRGRLIADAERGVQAAIGVVAREREGLEAPLERVGEHCSRDHDLAVGLKGHGGG
jgi:hypothetical protein